MCSECTKRPCFRPCFRKFSPSGKVLLCPSRTLPAIKPLDISTPKNKDTPLQITWHFTQKKLTKPVVCLYEKLGTKIAKNKTCSDLFDNPAWNLKLGRNIHLLLCVLFKSYLLFLFMSRQLIKTMNNYSSFLLGIALFSPPLHHK